MSALRTPGSRYYEIPKRKIQLGMLNEFEYSMLRLALRYAVSHATGAAEGLKPSGDPKFIQKRNHYLDQATEFRSLERLFIRDGRKGVSA